MKIVFALLLVIPFGGIVAQSSKERPDDDLKMYSKFGDDEHKGGGINLSENSLMEDERKRESSDEVIIIGGSGSGGYESSPDNDNDNRYDDVSSGPDYDGSGNDGRNDTDVSAPDNGDEPGDVPLDDALSLLTGAALAFGIRQKFRSK